MSNVRRISRFFLGLCLLAGAGIVLMFSAAFLYLSPNLPSVDVLRDVRLQTPLRVFTQNGELIGEFGEMRRTPIKFADIPPLFIKAVLAAEDDSFYSHHGVDFKSLMRATSQLAASGHIQTGGSTITMQVARNYLLSYEKTFSRKFNEILLALQIERSLSKNEILELYVNKIFLGNRAYGIEAAAQVYYGKSINELNLAELAMIAGIPKAPSSNNPIANPERALQRRNWILGRMLSLNSISRLQYDEAIQQPVGASYHGAVVDLDAGYAAEMARQEMLERFGPKVYTEGYVAYTTLDGRLQRTADQAVVETLLTYAQRHGYRGPERRLKPAANGDDQSAWRRQVATLPVLGGLWPAAVISVGERSFQALFSNGQTAQVQWENGVSDAARYSDVDHRGRSPQQASDVVAVGDVVRLRRDGKGEWQLQQIPAVQGALVSLNSDNGAILSLTGGFDFRQSKFNRVTQAARQPGSNFKPFIYTAALENGFTPATIINDAPIVFQDDQMENAWRPVNDTGKFYGPTPLRQALFKSRNVVSIRVLHQLGVATAINYVKRFGFDPSAMPRDLSLALGSLSATPMQIVRGFAVFANGGYLIEPYLIQRVLDRNGELVYEAKPKVACAGCGPETVATNPDAPNPPSAPNVTAPDATVALTTTGAPNAQMAPQVLDPRYAFIMDTMLRDVVRRGTAQGASALGRNDLAGKTGTTNGPTDLWFTGYAGGIVTTTWVGFDQNTPLGRREYGATTALPMWMDFMKVALAGRPERQMKQPEGVVSLRIDPHTGLRARPDQSDAIFEYFTEETAPTQESAPGAGSGSSTGGMSEQDLF